MSEKGGLFNKDICQITILPDYVRINSFKFYQSNNLEQIPKDYPRNGLSIILIPSGSATHLVYAQNCSTWKGFYDRPVLGWITGVDLNNIHKENPIVINGKTKEISETAALVLHLDLPENIYSEINILNLFEQSDGDIISFETSGFSVKNCLVNGKKTNFADYLRKNKIPTELPLVTNYHGSMINVSFKSVNDSDVEMYAPLFQGINYRLAKPLDNYAIKFEAELAKHRVNPIFSCNCILNYLYAKLEGKKTGNIIGPMTFGEIAYILLNQTMVYLTFKDKNSEGT